MSPSRAATPSRHWRIRLTLYVPDYVAILTLNHIKCGTDYAALVWRDPDEAAFTSGFGGPERSWLRLSPPSRSQLSCACPGDRLSRVNMFFNTRLLTVRSSLL